MHKTLYEQSQSVYAAAPVFERCVGKQGQYVSRWASVAFVLLTIVSASCNVILDREPDPEATCVNQCKDDRDPEPVDCAAAELGVEFLPLTLLDFNGSSASNLYGYSDGSVDFFRAITERGDDGVLQRDESQGVRSLGFEPGVRSDVARCIGEVPGESGVLHVQGGPFRAWGGAVGRHLKCLNSVPDKNVYEPERFSITYPAGDTPDALNKGCGTAPMVRACDEKADPVTASVCPQRDKLGAPPGEEFMLGMTLDLSQWDGISFWARRSNDSQPGIRLALGDKHTDDDLSYLQYHLNPDDERFCERNQECGCPGAKECVNGGCYDPRYQDPPDESEILSRSSIINPDEMITYLNEENEQGYSPCGQYMCERGFRAFRTSGGTDPREDVAYAGTTCAPFTFRGGITENYCYDPSGALPHENSQVCGDHWLKSVHLSTKWEF